MMQTAHLYAVIMAGGRGERLGPAGWRPPKKTVVATAGRNDHDRGNCAATFPHARTGTDSGNHQSGLRGPYAGFAACFGRKRDRGTGGAEYHAMCGVGHSAGCAPQFGGDHGASSGRSCDPPGEDFSGYVARRRPDSADRHSGYVRHHSDPSRHGIRLHLRWGARCGRISQDPCFQGKN